MKTYMTWGLSIFVAFIFIQSTFFKFSGAEETTIIFATIGSWIQSVGLPTLLAQGFSSYGAYGVGSLELIAALLILLPATRSSGALLALVVMSGAIFFHLFTPLGVDRAIDAAGNTDGGALFFTAVAIWISSFALLWLQRRPGVALPPEHAHPASA